LHLLWKKSGEKSHFCPRVLKIGMTIIQIPRLRSQINAIAIHIDNTQAFLSALDAFFRIYSQNKYLPQWLENDSAGLLTYDLAEAVMTEMESTFKILSRSHPREAIDIAEQLWQDSFFESKKLAIILLANLGDEHSNHSIKHIDQWIRDDIDERLFNEILAASEDIPFLVESEKWLELIHKWLNSDSNKMIKNGLKALGQLMIKKEFQNMPSVFSLTLPIYMRPEIAIQKELFSFTQLLIKKSQSETASFFITLGEIYPKTEVQVFIRKCLPLFDEYYQQELQRLWRS